MSDHRVKAAAAGSWTGKVYMTSDGNLSVDGLTPAGKPDGPDYYYCQTCGAELPDEEDVREHLEKYNE